MELVKEALSELFVLVFSGAVNIMFLLLSVLVAYAVRWVRRKFEESEISFMKAIATEAALYVQQTIPLAPNELKLQEALDKFVLILGERGIKADSEVLRTLIEASLLELKRDFGEQWEDL